MTYDLSVVEQFQAHLNGALLDSSIPPWNIHIHHLKQPKSSVSFTDTAAPTSSLPDWQQSKLFTTLSFFLDNGFPVNQADEVNGRTLLHSLAIIGGPIDVIRWLIREKGADINARYVIIDSFLSFMLSAHVFLSHQGTCVVTRRCTWRSGD